MGSAAQLQPKHSCVISTAASPNSVLSGLLGGELTATQSDVWAVEALFLLLLLSCTLVLHLFLLPLFAKEVRV